MTTKTILPLLFIAVACQPTLIAEFEDRPVVEAYLYAGEQVSVKISKLIPFREVSFSTENVHALNLTITDNTDGTTYALANDAMYNDSSYAIYTSAMLPQSGHTYQLSFMYDGQEVRAATHVPAVPQNVSLSRTTIAGGRGMAGASADIEISWDNADSAYYAIAVFALSTADTINSFMPNAQTHFQTAPAVVSSTSLAGQRFAFYGYHIVKVCRVQIEYVILYESMTNSIASSALAEVNANVEGGFGLFTAIGTYSDTIRVVPQ